MPLALGPLIGAGASLLGGLFGQSSQQKIAEQNIKLQKQFAQEGIQWKVADAKKAGVHPLYALGAQTASFSPVAVGSPLGGAIADMGQNIGRAVEASRSPRDKAASYEARVAELQLTNMELQNEMLGSRIALLRQAGQPPGVPVDVVGQPMVGPLAIGGSKVKPDPRFSDAELFEQRYGDSEFLQTLYGMGVAGADAGNWLAERFPWIDTADRWIKDNIFGTKGEY